MTRVPDGGGARQRDPDNLIAQGKSKPMLVVTLGYGAPEVLLPNPGIP
jgi:hypothetical protein